MTRTEKWKNKRNEMMSTATDTADLMFKLIELETDIRILEIKVKMLEDLYEK